MIQMNHYYMTTLITKKINFFKFQKVYLSILKKVYKFIKFMKNIDM